MPPPSPKNAPTGLLRDLLDLRARLIQREAALDAQVAAMLSRLYDQWEAELRAILGGGAFSKSVKEIIARRSAILQGLRRITAIEAAKVRAIVGAEAEAVYRSEVYRVASGIAKNAPASISTGGVSFSKVDVPAVRAALAMKDLPGRSEMKSLASIPAKVESLMRADLATAIADGYLLSDLVKKWRTRAGAGRVVGEIRSLARTSVMAASNAAHLDTYRANRDLVDGVVFESAFDRRVCVRCGALQGQEFSLVDAPTVPLHANCVLPGNVVSQSSVLAATKAMYRGEVVKIRTAGGRRISVTKKHPVLTSRGWIRAMDIRHGDDLVHHPLLDGIVAGINPNDQHGPSKIEEVFRSLEESDGVVSARVPVAAEHLHGDGDSVKGDIHVVWSDRLVANMGHPGDYESGTQIDLERALSVQGSQSLSALGHSDQLLNRLRLSAYRVVGGLSESESLGTGDLAHACEHCDRSITAIDFEEPQSASDHVSTYPEIIRDRQLALARSIPFGNHGIIELDSLGSRDLVSVSQFDPGLDQSFSYDLRAASGGVSDCLGALPTGVSLDRVVNIKREFYSGHVYDLQTVSGTINCNGLIIHNCRCVLLPTLIDKRINRFVYNSAAYQTPTGGTYFRTVDRSFEKFLRAQTPGFRADFFPSDLKRSAFESRKLSLPDMINRDGSIKTDDQIRRLLKKP